MAMVVKNNMSAVSTLNTLNKNSSALQKSLQKVSSGMKINSAQDDASGYAISEKMRVQIRSLDQANQNTQNASSMMKTAEGAVSSTVEILKSLKEKAINAATDTNTDSDRVTIQKELDQFIDQIDDNALTTFNGKYLVDGSKSQLGKSTYTAMTNQSLQTGTNGSTALTNLHNRNNENLEIEDTDYITASFVKNGKTYTTKFLVESTTLDQVFGKMNEQYQSEISDTTKAAFAGEAVTGSSNDNASGTVKTTAEIQALDETTKLAAAQGGVNEDLYATRADTTSTAAADLVSEVTDAVAAIKAKYTLAATGTGYAIGATYTDADGTTQAVAANATDSAAFVSALQDGVGTAVQAAAEKAATDTATTALSDIEDAIGAIIDSVRSPNSATAAPTGLTSTDLAAEITALATAVLDQQALANATSASSSNTSDLKAVDGTAITKDNADNYILSSSDVDALAADYGVTRSTDDTDESYAAKVLQAVIDEGQESSTAVTRTAAGDVTYMADGQAAATLNSKSDPDGYGSTQTGTAYYFDPDDVVSIGSDNKVTITAEKLQEGYDAYISDTTLSNGSGSEIAEPYAKAAQLANHIAGLQAKNATAAGIVNTVSTGDSKPTSGDLATDNVGSTTNLVGVNSAGDAVYTADGTEGLTVTAYESGVNGQISGVTLSISDSEGNVKKSANAALDNFKTTIYAKNKSDSNELSFQVGGAANQSIAVGLDDMRSEALGLKGSDGSKVSVATQDKANAAVAVFDNAIQKALDQQTTIGAVEARLDYTSQNLTTSSENVQAAESTIRDADMAKEMTNYTKNNVLLQAAQSMLAQANQSSSQVLSLLQ